MKTARFIARILYYVTRISAVLYLLVTAYALAVVLLFLTTSASWLPVSVSASNGFVIYYPFTQTPFLLGDYSLFTKKGFSQLSRFYSVNLTVPVLILIILAVLGQEVQDIIRITFLHLVIGVFAFFMAAIFKQGLFLQEEQDLIF
jgi:hypothetical protein